MSEEERLRRIEAKISFIEGAITAMYERLDRLEKFERERAEAIRETLERLEKIK